MGGSGLCIVFFSHKPITVTDKLCNYPVGYSYDSGKMHKIIHM